MSLITCKQDNGFHASKLHEKPPYKLDFQNFLEHSVKPVFDKLKSLACARLFSTAAATKLRVFKWVVYAEKCKRTKEYPLNLILLPASLPSSRHLEQYQRFLPQEIDEAIARGRKRYPMPRVG